MQRRPADAKDCRAPLRQRAQARKRLQSSAQAAPASRRKRLQSSAQAAPASRRKRLRSSAPAAPASRRKRLQSSAQAAPTGAKDYGAPLHNTMIYPRKARLSWGGDVELQAQQLPEWAATQPLSWTITSGQGSIVDLGGMKIRFIGPEGGPDVPTRTVIHLFAGDSAEPVGECTITFDIPLMDPKMLRDLPQEPEPDPPPEEKEIIIPVECCADPEDPTKPLKITPVQVSMGPDENLFIRIPRIHEDCQHGCYTWRIAYGGGRLICNCGPRAVYRSPSLNNRCENNALIELICDTIPIAHAYVTINTWAAGAIAYETFEGSVD